MTDHPERPPFAAHRRYYFIVKMIVLAAAAAVAIAYMATQGPSVP